MILLNPIIEVAIGAMPHFVAEFGPDRFWIAVVSVRRHPGRRDAGDRLGRTEERPGSCHVACFAQPHVHQRARRIDGTIEVAPATLDLYVGLVDIPAPPDLAAAPPSRALVRFVPDARVGDVTTLLDKYQASIIDGAKGGMFRLQFANAAMSKDEFAGLLSRMQSEKIVSLAVATP